MSEEQNKTSSTDSGLTPEKIKNYLYDESIRFRLMSDVTYEGIVVSHQGTILDVNQAMCNMFGYTREEFAGTLSAEHIVPEHRDEHLRHVQKNDDLEYEADCLKKDRTRFHTAIKGKKVMMEGIEFRITSVRDISQQQQMKQALQSRESMFSIFINNASEGFIHLGADHKIVDVNLMLCQMTGYSPHEMIGKSPFEFIAPSDHGRIKEKFATIRTTDHISYELNILSREGEEIPTLVHSATIRNEKDEYIGSFGFLSDTSQCVAIESELRSLYSSLEKEKLKQEHMLIHQSKLATMGEMINSIAHQWKQPLQALSLLTQTIVDQYTFGELNQQTLELFQDRVQHQIEFMSETIEDFRNFLKPGKEKKPFDVSAATRDIIRLLEKQFEKSDITIAMDSEGECSAFGFVNEFKQVVLNLLINSKEAFSDIRDPKHEKAIHISVKDDSGCIHISICDNACGIPEETLSQIFQPYFSTKGDGGTGIGLYLARIIIEENMHGSIKASGLEQGVCFHIRIPKN